MESWAGAAACSAFAVFCRRTSLDPSRVCLFRKSANILCTSKLNCLASCSRTSLTSETIGSSHIELLPHQFFWSANDRHTISLPVTDNCRPSDYLSVGEVFAVPCQNVVHIVDCGNCDMSGIPDCIGRNGTAGYDCCCKRFSLFGDLKYRKIADDCHPCFRLFRVSSRCLIKHDLRNEAFEIGTSLEPPILCGLLMSCNNKIPAWTRDEVAY